MDEPPTKQLRKRRVLAALMVTALGLISLAYFSTRNVQVHKPICVRSDPPDANDLHRCEDEADRGKGYSSYCEQELCEKLLSR